MRATYFSLLLSYSILSVLSEGTSWLTNAMESRFFYILALFWKFLTNRPLAKRIQKIDLSSTPSKPLGWGELTWKGARRQWKKARCQSLWRRARRRRRWRRACCFRRRERRASSGRFEFEAARRESWSNDLTRRARPFTFMACSGCRLRQANYCGAAAVGCGRRGRAKHTTAGRTLLSAPRQADVPAENCN